MPFYVTYCCKGLSEATDSSALVLPGQSSPACAKLKLEAVTQALTQSLTQLSLALFSCQSVKQNQGSPHIQQLHVNTKHDATPVSKLHVPRWSQSVPEPPSQPLNNDLRATLKPSRLINYQRFQGAVKAKHVAALRTSAVSCRNYLCQIRLTNTICKDIRRERCPLSIKLLQV